MPGCIYEIGARIAFARADMASFQERADLCERNFRLGKHPALTARCNALRRGGVRSRVQGKSVQPIASLAPSDGLMQTLQELTHKQLDDATFFRSMLDRLIEIAAAIGGVLYVRKGVTVRRVAMAGEIAARPELDAAAARSCALDDDASETALESDMQASSDLTAVGRLGIYILERTDGDTRSIEGVLVLELTNLVHSTSLRSRLRGVGAVMYERSRMCARDGDPPRARTAPQGNAASLPDESTTTATQTQ